MNKSDRSYNGWLCFIATINFAATSKIATLYKERQQLEVNKKKLNKYRRFARPLIPVSKIAILWSQRYAEPKCKTLLNENSLSTSVQITGPDWTSTGIAPIDGVYWKLCITNKTIFKRGIHRTVEHWDISAVTKQSVSSVNVFVLTDWWRLLSNGNCMLTYIQEIDRIAFLSSKC